MKVGDIVRIHEKGLSDDAITTKEYKVSKIIPSSVDGYSPRLKGYARKKDGNWSKVPSNIYGKWEVVKEESNSE